MTNQVTLDAPNIAVIGLGYVGLPLATAFGGLHKTLGFDINAARIAQLNQDFDATREVTGEELKAASHLRFSADKADLADSNVYIVTVPTPVTAARVPDLTPMENASRTIAPYLRPGDVVVYESTVYPGATEEICVPLLEQGSGLAFNSDFFVGYSPERINPGDKQHRLATITKVVAGSTPATLEALAALYGEVVTAGIHKVSSIQVAEAAKVIENTQRDINVALVNELAMIFGRLGLDSQEVFAAAGTKWNFLPFRPGLVGGHCIGVDPYYLTYKAQASGYYPEMVLAGRRINDGMGRYIASELVRLMLGKRIHVNGARVLVMGITFKENCPDIRNTRVTDIIHELVAMEVNVDVYDPWADPAAVEHEHGVSLLTELAADTFDAALVAVGHEEFCTLGVDAIRGYCRASHVIYDVKSIFPRESVDGRL